MQVNTAMIFSSDSFGDFAANAVIGINATGPNCAVILNQTTPSISLTLPTPSSFSWLVHISNQGTASVRVNNVDIQAGRFVIFNGDANGWRPLTNALPMILLGIDSYGPGVTVINVPTNATHCNARLQGAGGGGTSGVGVGGIGCGGAGGGYVETGVVSLGGAATLASVIAPGGATGVAGGVSTLIINGVTYTANGGREGLAALAAGAGSGNAGANLPSNPGGVAGTTGLIRHGGAPSYPSMRFNASILYPSQGAISKFGVGGAPLISAVAAVAGAGQNGGGGGGGASTGAGTVTGGAGGDALLIIEWYQQR